MKTALAAMAWLAAAPGTQGDGVPPSARVTGTGGAAASSEAGAPSEERPKAEAGVGAGAPPEEGPKAEAGLDLHAQAAARLHLIVEETFAEVTRRVRAGEPLTEGELQAFVERAFRRDGLVSDGRPIVSAGAHSADPTYQSTADASIREGDLLVLDLFARKDAPGAVYADIAWVAYVGKRKDVPPRIAKVWNLVREARDRTLETLRDRTARGRAVTGEELDAVARAVVRKGKHEPWYLHATGHALGELPYGEGANLKRGETRTITPPACVTIEPGIYYPDEFGVRSRIGVCVRGNAARVTGGGRRSAARDPGVAGLTGYLTAVSFTVIRSE